MTKETFLTKLQDVLQREESIDMGMDLSSIEEWDSLATMATIAFVDKEFNVKLTLNDFKNMKKISDIFARASA